MNLFSWFSKTPQKIGFEDVQWAIKQPAQYMIINTIVETDQEHLIYGTLTISEETEKINQCIQNQEFTQYTIILYGRNSTDDSTLAKYKQLTGIGFSNVAIYAGGMFEWLLLQDVYGFHEFPTTKRILDILKFKPGRTFNVPRIGF
jgi:hypothetical protein